MLVAGAGMDSCLVCEKFGSDLGAVVVVKDWCFCGERGVATAGGSLGAPGVGRAAGSAEE